MHSLKFYPSNILSCMVRTYVTVISVKYIMVKALYNNILYVAIYSTAQTQIDACEQNTCKCDLTLLIMLAKILEYYIYIL